MSSQPADKTRWWTLAMATSATFMLILDVTVVNIALPQLHTSLGATFTDMQWVLDAYTVTLAAFLLTGGSLADRLGRKRLFNVGLVIFTLASLAAGSAQSILALKIARAVQGTGAAVLFAVAPALIGQEFRGKERGMAFGLFGGIIGLALALGPLVGGVLAGMLSWRWIFLVNVPIGVVVIAISVARLRESRSPVDHGIDWLGMVTFTAALALLVFGILRGEALGWASAPILELLGGSVVMLIVFVAIQQRRRERAMLDLTLFRISTFSAVCLATLISNATSLAAIFLEVTYLQNVLGYSPLAAGIRLLPLTLTLFVVAAMTGPAVNKVSPGVLLGASIGLIAAGMGLILLIEPGSSWTALLPSMIVMGVGMGLFNPPRAAVTIGVVEPARGGMASGMGETFQQVGVAVGIAAFGALFHHRVVDAFSSSPLAARLGERTAELAHAAATGAPATTALDPGVMQQVTELSRTVYVHGFTGVMGLCGIVCAVGAVIAFLFIRRSDLHESAVGEPDAAKPVASVDAADVPA
ncbi:MAG TPA: MFS transporter [Kofleriaceae bacterium]|nr:MFS transporter [Kofleriaceae bacterium]